VSSQQPPVSTSPQSPSSGYVKPVSQQQPASIEGSVQTGGEGTKEEGQPLSPGRNPRHSIGSRAIRQSIKLSQDANPVLSPSPSTNVSAAQPPTVALNLSEIGNENKSVKRSSFEEKSSPKQHEKVLVNTFPCPLWYYREAKRWHSYATEISAKIEQSFSGGAGTAQFDDMRFDFKKYTSTKTGASKSKKFIEPRGFTYPRPQNGPLTMPSPLQDWKMPFKMEHLITE